MIYVWNKKVNWPEPESKADNRYFDYVAKRYQAYPNLIWDISKEALDYGHDDISYITRRITRLRRLDAHDRLLTVHDYKYCSAFPGEVDIISIQEWEPYLYPRMVEVRNAHANKPVFNIEHGGYEKSMHTIFDGAYTDPLTCLDRTYQCFFAGTYSTYYWQQTAWYNVIPEPFSLPQSQQPHFQYYQHLMALFAKYEFNKLHSDQKTFSPPMLSDGESMFLFYLSNDRTGIYGRLEQIAGKTVNIRWFDPLTGQFHESEKKEYGESAWLGLRRHPDLTGPSAIAVLEVVE